MGVFTDLKTQDQFGKALLLLGAFYVLSAADFGAINDLSGVFFILILLMIITNDSVPRKLRHVAYVSAAVSAVLTLTRAFATTPETIALDALSTMVVVSVTVVAILARVLSQDSVTLPTVMGAFLAYALLGFGAGLLFGAVDALTDEMFFGEPVAQDDYIYFSMITLTTVGFGDLTPVSELAKRLVVMEALMGQVFLVVLVARMVSLWKVPDHRKRPKQADADDS